MVEAEADRGDVVPVEGISDRILLTRNMLKSAAEFGDCRQMTLLSGGARVGLLGEGVDERQMVHLDGEGRPFDEMASVANGSMDGEQLPIGGGVERLGWREHPTEEGERLSCTVEDLLEDITNGDVTSVGGED